MAEPALPIFRTVDDFLMWEERQEERQEERYEFVGGVLTLVAGGTENQDLIGVNAIGILHALLRGSPCRVHGSQLKVRSPARAIMYPDAFVRCGPLQGERTVVDDPVLVVEVLSPRTQQGDLTRKRWAYQAIPAMQAVLFVAADEPRVELVMRGPDGTWVSRFCAGLEDAVPPPALGSSCRWPSSMPVRISAARAAKAFERRRRRRHLRGG
jgi:Uma2 family endonuclease